MKCPYIPFCSHAYENYKCEICYCSRYPADCKHIEVFMDMEESDLLECLEEKGLAHHIIKGQESI